jgi:hypothetical protein
MLESDKSYRELKHFLSAHCFVYPVPFVTLHNLFTLHYIWGE